MGVLLHFDSTAMTIRQRHNSNATHRRGVPRGRPCGLKDRIDLGHNDIKTYMCIGTLY